MSRFCEYAESQFLTDSMRSANILGTGSCTKNDGFRNMLLGYRDADRGHILENVVFLELLRRDYRVYIGKVGETEVDFVAGELARGRRYKCSQQLWQYNTYWTNLQAFTAQAPFRATKKP